MPLFDRMQSWMEVEPAIALPMLIAAIVIFGAAMFLLGMAYLSIWFGKGMPMENFFSHEGLFIRALALLSLSVFTIWSGFARRIESVGICIGGVLLTFFVLMLFMLSG